MNPTYTFIGGDNREYGPHPLETIQAWIGEGRLLPDTRMARSDAEGWFRAGDFQEFTWPGTGTAGSPAGAGPVAAGAAPAVRVVTAPRPAEPAADAPSVTGGPRPVAGGLGAVDPGAVAEMRAHASWFYWIAGISLILTVMNNGVAGLVFALPFAAAFAGLGYFACRAHQWAFIVGLILMIPLVLLSVLGRQWLSVLIRCWAVYEVFKGFLIARTIRKSLR